MAAACSGVVVCLLRFQKAAGQGREAQPRRGQCRAATLGMGREELSG